MGKTFPSYRMAQEDEIQRWSDFARALRAEEKEAFETIMDACPKPRLSRRNRNAADPLFKEKSLGSFAQVR